VSKIPNLASIDALVMTVAHNSLKKINFSKLLKSNQKIIILDTFNILTNKQIMQIKKKKCKILSIGRGIDR
jgi:UDP-N-acetyl-D-mannosaminuronate dehydrogenase